MSRIKRAHGFAAVRVEGGLMPPEFLREVAAQQASHQTPGEYGVSRSLQLKDELGRFWHIARDLWKEYTGRRVRADVDKQEAAVEFLTEFFARVLEYKDIRQVHGATAEGRHFAITHQAAGGRVPFLFIPHQFDDLDRAEPRFGEEGRRRSPANLMQEYLNADDGVQWGIVSNGNLIRLMRDNPSLTRPAYIECDLELMLNDEIYADFTAMWLLLHGSRLRQEGQRTGTAVLEKWRLQAHETGERALEKLRAGVAESMRVLGSGFVAQPANESLRQRIASGVLSPQGYYQQLLRLVYRFLFLFTVEDRDLLFPPKTKEEKRQLYMEGYSLAMLRERALRRGQHDLQYSDLWQGLQIIFRGLAGDEEVQSALGLPGLDGLFAAGQCPDIEEAQVSNSALLQAVWALAYFKTDSGLARVNYRDMDTEELGSVYEGLLELHPQFQVETVPWTFGFLSDVSEAGARGSERKSTGSYYTPSSLVDELIKSALEPVMAKAAADNPANPRQAILDLNVIDPACGSGHFLLAAARRMAAEIARLEADGKTPDEQVRRHALRQVVQHCIYGVDKNPLAVELCRAALWIETIEPGKPLSFLDSHIQWGDSLIGLREPSVLLEGIPMDAYKALTGDDPAAERALKERNKTSVFNFQLRFDQPSVAALPDEDEADVESMPEDTLADLAAKRAKWNGIRRRRKWAEAKDAADLFVAAFFLPKRMDTLELVPVNQDLARLVHGESARPGVLEAAHRVSEEQGFLHWHLAFPQVMKRGGFDVVLGNPPWDTLSPDAKEFFSTYDPAVRFQDPQGQAALIAALLENPEIAKRWTSHCRNLYTSVHFFKTSGQYVLFAPGNLGKGDFNVYRMFVELALRITRAWGYLAQVVPEGFYNGANAMAIRRALFEETSLEKVLGFVNTGEVWFDGVDTRQKFCLYAARKSGRTESFEAAFNLNSPDQLNSRSESIIDLPVDMVREFSPDALAIMEFDSQHEIDIAAKMYSGWPKFGTAVAGTPHREYMREIDMGNDQERFGADPTEIPLYEGRMVSQFDHRAKGYRSGRGRAAVWEDLPFEFSSKSIQPQWYVIPNRVPDKITERMQRYRIGFCDVTSPTNERTLVAALIPPGCLCGHKVPTVTFERDYEWAYMLWLSVANSYAMDFLARKKVALTMSYTVLDSLPFPRIGPETEVAKRIVPLALQLTCTGPEMTNYWNERAAEGWVDPVESSALPGLVDEHQRLKTRAELDAIVARDLFKLTKGEMDYVLGTFPIVEREEKRRYGSFLTRELILQHFG